MSNLPSVVLSPGVSTTVNVPVGSYALKVSNTSPYDLDFGGYGVVGDDWIPGGTEYMLYSSVHESGSVSMTFVNNRSITPANSGVVLLVAYPNKSSVPIGTWPISIPQSVVQSSGGVTTANTLVNQGNPAGTAVVTTQVSGDVNNAIQMSNDANVTFGDASHPGSFTENGGSTFNGGASFNAGGTSIACLHNETIGGTLAVTGTSSLDNGNLTTDGSGNVTSSGGKYFFSTRGTIDFSGFDGFFNVVNSGNTGHLQFGGTDSATWSSSGFTVVNGVNFSVGRIKEINTGTTTTSGSVAVSHGLSGTPSAVLVTPASSGATSTFSASSYTSTQFTLLNGSGVSQTFRWVAYR